MPPPNSDDLEIKSISPNPSSRRAGEAQCLGEMPWKHRATAIEPGGNEIAQSTDAVKFGHRQLCRFAASPRCRVAFVLPLC
jgi:hypothetical protein